MPCFNECAIDPYHQAFDGLISPSIGPGVLRDFRPQAEKMPADVLDMISGSLLVRGYEFLKRERDKYERWKPNFRISSNFSKHRLA